MVISSAQEQNIAWFTVNHFPILNTQDENNTADSPGIRPYSDKISFCCQMVFYILLVDDVLQKYIVL